MSFSSSSSLARTSSKPPIHPNGIQPHHNQQSAKEERASNREILHQLELLILDSEEEQAIQLIKSLDKSCNEDLQHYRAQEKDDDDPSNDVSLLQLASAYSMSTELMSLLAAKCPGLLTVQRQNPYEGQTPIHTLVSKENISGVKSILSQLEPARQFCLLKMSTVTDRISSINATVMLGGLPLSIAALTFNLDMVDMLLEHGGELSDKNDRGDTVFHSLVRFSALYPDKESKAEEMMQNLHQRLKEMHEPRSVWLTENKQGLTVLKLAAQCTRPLLFNFIITLKGVYCDLDEHDGLFDSLLYDITDIDPVAIHRVSEKTTATFSVKHNQVDTVHGVPKAKKNFQKKALGGGSGLPPTPHEATTSILDIIYETDNVDDAFKILDNHVVRRVIKQKWRKYAPVFCVWTFLHLLVMIWLTIYAVYKSKVTTYNPDFNMSGMLNNTAINPAIYTDVDYQGKLFVYITAVCSAVWSLLLLTYETVRLIRGRSLKEYLVTLLFHHNGFYRLQLIFLALFLLVDAITLAVWGIWHGEANNYSLIVALLVGWWFCAFFLRPWKKFSFFTVMLQEVLLGDMLRFSTIFIPQLLAFSIAMYITFLPSERILPVEFHTVGRTMMTMFKLMLGLSDIAVLYEAPQNWLAILLFVLYVLLTYSLMLNALIALMSNTCSIVSQNRYNQWKLQRLSIVLFLQESLWPFTCLTATGTPKYIKIEDLQTKNTTTVTRYVMKISSVRGGDGGSILLGAVKNLVDGDAGEVSDEPQTKASSEMCDLLAARNFQRRQKQIQSQKRDDLDESKSSEEAEGTGAGNIVITNTYQQNVNAAYINIRKTLQKMSTSARPSSARGAHALQSNQQRNKGLLVSKDEPDTAMQHPHNTEPRHILNNVPEIHPIPQANPRIVLLPSPCMITTVGPPQERSAKRTEKRQKFCRRPDSAELQERFRKRREQLVRSPDTRKGSRRKSVEPVEPKSLDRPPSAASGIGYGIFPVDLDDSRIHMHTKV